VSGSRIERLERDGLAFDVRDSGPLDGAPVILLHGFPQRATCWDAVAHRLTAAGLRVLAPDQRGYSPGARPASVAAYRLDHLVDDVAGLVDVLGGRAHVVGHDWGASVAWALAASRPEQVASLTALSVPHPRAFVAALRRPDQARRSLYMALFQLPWLPERLLAGRPGTAALRRSGMDEQMLARYRREVVEDGALPGALHWYRALRVQGGPGGLAAPVEVPTTYVWSDRDSALGREGAESCGAHVQADYRFEVLAGALHWLPEQRPAEVARLIDERVRSG
jgi:pimeloyl-ACP methyl ester carboxylesterase